MATGLVECQQSQEHNPTVCASIGAHLLHGHIPPAMPQAQQGAGAAVPTPTFRHTSIIHIDIKIRSECCVFKVWSLERDVSDILDADLTTNKGKEMSITASLDKY